MVPSVLLSSRNQEKVNIASSQQLGEEHLIFLSAGGISLGIRE